MVETASQDNNLKINKKVEVGTDNLRHGMMTRVVEKFGTTKEKIYDFFRYKQLKIKEYFGRIDNNEFTELLEYDFKSELVDNKPITGIFSPIDEIKKIKTLPIGGRSEVLGQFHEKNTRQTQAWSACRVFIERQIEFNPDVDKGGLTNWIEKFGAEYGFSDKQKEVANGIIDKFQTKRMKAKEIRNKYENDLELVNYLSGLNFTNQNKFEISVGPMSIDISTNSSTFSKIYSGSENALPLPYVGFAATKGEDGDEVYFNVIDTKKLRKRSVRKEVLKHEWEHQKNRLFRKVFDTKLDKTKDESLHEAYATEPDIKTKESLLKSWLINQRLEGLNNAKDELIAMKKGGWWDVGRFFRKDKSPYDYLSWVREVENTDQSHRKIVNEILVGGYKKIIDSGIKAFEKLEKKGKMTRDEVIAVLTNKSIGQWPRFADRLIKEQGQKVRGLSFA